MILYVNLCRDRQEPNKLEKSMRRKMPDMVEYIHDISDMEKRLQDSIYNIEAMIIELSSSSPIDRLMAHKEDLKNLNLVLVLDGITSDKQIAKMLQLYPRYMTFSPNDNTVLSVLENRLRKIPRTAKSGATGADQYNLSGTAASNY